MSTPNHQIIAQSISERSLNNIIEVALNQAQQGTSTPPPLKKRKPKDQLSGEKEKPHKITNTNNTPPSTPNSPTNIDTMYNENKDRPRMLRHNARELQGTPCVSAYYTREAILKKDATHPEAVEVEMTLTDVNEKISDYILSNQHKLIDALDKTLKDLMIKALSDKDEQNATFFTAGSDQMRKLTDSAFQNFLSLCDAQPDLKRDSNGHYEKAKQDLASKLSAHIPVILNASKNELTPFITVPSRGTALNKELTEIIIRGANFDNKWTTIIHDTMPTANSNISTHTLANTVHNLQNNTEKHESEITEIDHQITKISIRVGDLKTSEMEMRHQQVENIIRLHNINSIGEGTPNHFRTLSHANQTKEIRQIVNNNLSGEHSYSTNIITPRDNTRHFDPLAIITFSNSSSKFDFEKNFADYRRKNPSFKVTSSRPTPQKTTSDRDQPDVGDIKAKLGMLYNQKILEAQKNNPNIAYKPLSHNDIEAIQVQLKSKKKPFSTYWEFLCPTNNSTFMVYTPSTNPFQNYDFNHPIANPLTRKHAVSEPKYEKRFPPKIHNRRK